MKIYTKKGDSGKTLTVKGAKVSKASTQIELQGSIDEVNSMMGHLRAVVLKTGNNARYKILIEILCEQLKHVQKTLYKIGIDISNDFETQYVKDADIKILENDIDNMNMKTGDLEHFIYLSGHETATYAHTLRSVIRRAERVFVKYMEELDSNEADKKIPFDYQYMNRLADYIFQVARYLNWFFDFDEEMMILDE
jgi:cob(I)alamin adenosyltransferase